MRLHATEKIFLPLLFIIFFITYHYYSFYQKDFGGIFTYIKQSFSQNQYEAIQEKHPFYYVYKIAQDSARERQDVIYVKTRVEKNNPQYLDELNIMVNYFFYPRIIPPYTLAAYKKTVLKPNTYIISDKALPLNAPNRLTPVPFVKHKLNRINRWPESPYFIYQVKES